MIGLLISIKGGSNMIHTYLFNDNTSMFLGAVIMVILFIIVMEDLDKQ